MVHLLMVVEVDFGRKIDYDDEMRSIVMLNRDAMENDQDLFDMVD